MSADLLIHATLTVSGDSALLPAADARIKALLVGEIFEGGFEEHHGDDERPAGGRVGRDFRAAALRVAPHHTAHDVQVVRAGDVLCRICRVDRAGDVRDVNDPERSAVDLDRVVG